MTAQHTACILCSRNCGLLVETDGTHITKVRGDDSTPSSKGYICQKAARLTHYQKHEDRLQKPLKRRPDGSFEEVSWDQALGEIAAKIKTLHKAYGGNAFAMYGGGGQGNHLGGAYNRQFLHALRSYNAYNALGQEKTGDFWVNGRMFGRQTCHTTEDVEHADYLLVIGANPFQAHGIPNARDTLKHFQKDPNRTLVVVDPRKTETARMADLHLQVKPGTDTYLMAAMLSIIVREGLHDQAFLEERCRGFDEVKTALLKVPVADYIEHTGIPAELVYEVARGYARAKRACLRIDLGIQQALNSTLNSYLEKLLFLVTGNFGRQGGNNLHTILIPVIGHTDERNPRIKRTANHKMFPIASILPPNILADEIDHEGENRIRALLVDSGNPAVTVADTPRLEQAFKRLDLMVVVDVAMTETARHAHYVLPAASQLEKFEATGFNLEFPENYFHLRHPLFKPLGDSLPEPEIYTRLFEHLGMLPKRFRLLEFIAKHEPKFTGGMLALGAFGLTVALKPKLAWLAPSILYRTLGKRYGEAASAVVLLPLSILYAAQHSKAVRNAGVKGWRWQQGVQLFRRILDNPQGVVLSRHRFDDTWSLIKTEDKRIDVAPRELVDLLDDLPNQPRSRTSEQFPLVLAAGERRTYNANQIYRNPEWRKQDPHGALRIHPDDAQHYGVADGTKAICESERGAIEVHVEIDDSVHRGFVSLPHGYGMRFRGSEPIGPQLNLLTSVHHCDPITRTPYHKHVPVNIRPLAA